MWKEIFTTTHFFSCFLFFPLISKSFKNHTICKILTVIKDMEERQLNHFSHKEHPLILSELWKKKDNDIDQEVVVCYVY